MEPVADNHDHAIEAFVKARAQELLPCAKHVPNLKAALVTWSVVQGGRADRVTLQAMAANSPAYEACIVDAVKNWHFPSAPSPVTVRAALVFDD